MNVFQHLLFKFILILCGQSLSSSVTVDLPFVNLDDLFHSLPPIMDPQGMEGPAMLDGEEAVAKVAALKERENAKGDAANALK